MEITGNIIWAGDFRSGVSAQSGKTWASQDYVVESRTQGAFGEQIQRVCFNVFGEDKIAEYGLRVGVECKVYYGVNAREYQGKWYNDVRAWKVETKSPLTPQGGTVQPGIMSQQYAQQQMQTQQYAQQMYAGGQQAQAQPQQQYAQPQQQAFPPEVDPVSGLPF